MEHDVAGFFRGRVHRPEPLQLEPLRAVEGKPLEEPVHAAVGIRARAFAADLVRRASAAARTRRTRRRRSRRRFGEIDEKIGMIKPIADLPRLHGENAETGHEIDEVRETVPNENHVLAAHHLVDETVARLGRDEGERVARGSHRPSADCRSGERQRCASGFLVGAASHRRGLPSRSSLRSTPADGAPARWPCSAPRDGGYRCCPRRPSGVSRR